MLYRRENKRQRRSAFTLMEMLVVVAIIVALAGIGAFFVMPQLAGGQKDAALIKAKALTAACQAYSIKNNGYPDSLRQLLTKDQNGYGPYVEDEDALKDPWGQEYQYDKSGPRNNNQKPDIWTRSASEENVLLGNWPKGR